MSIVAYIVFGLFAGFLASRMVNTRGEAFFLDIGLGIGGAVIAGLLFSSFGEPEVAGLDLYDSLAAVIGAFGVVIGYHTIWRRNS